MHSNQSISPAGDLPSPSANQEPEHHDTLLSSLSTLVHKKTTALTAALHQSQQQHALLQQQLHSMTELQQHTQEQLNQTVQQHQETKRGHNDVMAAAANQIDAYRQTMEDQLVEMENQVHQRVAREVKDTLAKVQQEHDDTVAALQNTHAALLAQHASALQTFDTCKIQFQRDIESLKELYTAKTKTLQVEHENHLILAHKNHKQALMEQNTSHHHAIQLQKQMHGTTMMVQQTTLEAQVDSELATVKQSLAHVQEERNHYQIAHETCNNEKNEIEQQYQHSVHEHMNQTKDLKQEHQQNMALLQQQHRATLLTTMPKKEHATIALELQQQVEEFKTQALACKHQNTVLVQEHAAALNDREFQSNTQSDKHLRQRQLDQQEHERNHANEVKQLNSKWSVVVARHQENLDALKKELQRKEHQHRTLMQTSNHELIQCKQATHDTKEQQQQKMFQTHQKLHQLTEELLAATTQSKEYNAKIVQLNKEVKGLKTRFNQDRMKYDMDVQRLTTSLMDAKHRLVGKELESQEEQEALGREHGRALARMKECCQVEMTTFQNDCLRNVQQKKREHVRQMQQHQDESEQVMVVLRKQAEKEIEWVAQECHGMMLMDAGKVRPGHFQEKGKGTNDLGVVGGGGLHRSPSVESIESTLLRNGGGFSIAPSPVGSPSLAQRSSMALPPQVVRANFSVSSVDTSVDTDENNLAERGIRRKENRTAMVGLEKTMDSDDAISGLRAELQLHVDTLSMAAIEVTKQVVSSRQERIAEENRARASKEKQDTKHQGSSRRSSPTKTSSEKQKHPSTPRARLKIIRVVCDSDDDDGDGGDTVHQVRAEYELQRKEREAREKGWNDTVGSPRRNQRKGNQQNVDSPPVFEANLNQKTSPSIRKKFRKKRNGGKKKGTASSSELRSDGLDRHMIVNKPKNPAWVGAGRRGSTFGHLNMTAQQNHRGTFLTPAGAVFNMRNKK